MMFRSISSLLVFMYINSRIIFTKQDISTTYYVRENVEANFLIGNVISDAFMSQASSSADITGLKILKKKFPDVEYFKIEPDSGKLFTKRVIDRERACPNARQITYLNSHEDITCEVILQIFAESIQQQVRIRVIIKDENDNAPSWHKKILTVTFRDGDGVGTKKELPLPTDPDVGTNGLITYDLINDPPSDQRFTLIKRKNSLYLHSVRPVDREERGFYTLTLIARDKGKVPLTTSIPIKVTIQDINDNDPTFTKQEFRRNEPIPETTLAGQIVLWLTATDNDTDMNGRIHFKISQMDKNSKAAHYFRVNHNGSIVVRSPLDYDRGENKFQFKVTVEDEAVYPYTRSSEATVYLTLRDENDEKPEISIQYPNTEFGHAVVRENQPTNMLVAFITVTDLDYDKTDIVECKVPNENFSLILLKNEPNEYELKTAIQFDRETTPFQKLMISCNDKLGHTTNLNITLKISDLNDNAPKFNKSIFKLYLAENEVPGTQLRKRVYAYDLDEGINQQIEYRMAPTYASNFSINPRSGEMTSKVTFNREEAESYTVHVLAIDRGSPQQTSTGTVLVTITDVNDNPPLFSRNSYKLHVSENQPRLTKVGQVFASDSDHRSKILFSLGASKDAQQFSINRHTGLINTRIRLNRELQKRYEFPVIARDASRGQTRMHMTTATVTVTVDDVNDNSPVFILPNATFNIFEIDAHKTLGHTIANIRATDADGDDVSYSIKSGNSLQLFNLDTSSGLLFLANQLPPNVKTFYLLAIEACDSGTPKRCTSYNNLRIKVKGDLSVPPPNSDGYETIRGSGNEPIIICLSVIFVILVLATVVLICLIRRKAYWIGAQRNRKQNARNTSPLKSPNSCPVESDINIKEIKSHATILEDEALLRLKVAKSMTLDSRKHRKRSNLEDYPPDYQTLDGLCLATSGAGSVRYTSCDPSGSMMHTYYEISPSRGAGDHEINTYGASSGAGMSHPLSSRDNFLIDPGAEGLERSTQDGSLTCPTARKLAGGGGVGVAGYPASDKGQYIPKYTYSAYCEASFV